MPCRGRNSGWKMETPVYDFVQSYAKSGVSRFHMPGHKGIGPLGVEMLDITEIAGADSLYEAEGIIRESEKNATLLFGTGATFFSTEGSSHVIRAMLCLALAHQRERAAAKTRPVIVAARNAHKAFLTAAALLDFDIVWLWGDAPQENGLCACPVTAQGLSAVLDGLAAPPAAVYVTSPDYLGGMLEIGALADTAHAYGTLLLVDNAHGAYLHFLPLPAHPMDMGADLCCDSAHKTLPVLTGGAYLHIGYGAMADIGCDAEKNVRQALALFGSTSPSYLILQSLDLANRYLAQGYRQRLAACAQDMEVLRGRLRVLGWKAAYTEPLKLTLETAKCGYLGGELAGLLRASGVECEYADPDALVFMAAPENTREDFARLLSCMEGIPPKPPIPRRTPEFLPPRRVLGVRDAVFAPQERIPAFASAGRVMGAAAVHCPPAIPVVVSGEEIGQDVPAVFAYYGITEVDVIK